MLTQATTKHKKGKAGSQKRSKATALLGRFEFGAPRKGPRATKIKPAAALRKKNLRKKRSVQMFAPAMALLLAALADPGALATALPPQAPPSPAAFEALRKKVDGFDTFREETREKQALLAAEVERPTKAQAERRAA